MEQSIMCQNEQMQAKIIYTCGAFKDWKAPEHIKERD